jgi:UDP-N-acetylglucosamine 2-epimerase (non-hydrolysing)
MKKILLVFGTRPEAIKMAPLYHELKKHNDAFDVKVCVSAQHREMLDQVLDFFDIMPHYDLNLMKHNQTLFDITANLLTGIDAVLDDFRPELVFVQGDTTTTFTASLAAYYKKIKVAHLEAGLRSFNKYSPFPEEINRRLTSVIADFHFAPTETNKDNLLAEGYKNNIYVVGNTVIDALFLGLNLIEKKDEDGFAEQFRGIDFTKRIILVTGHRRESFGLPFENICRALKKIATEFDVEIVYPVHLNPNVRKPVNEILSNLPNVHLLEPLDYPSLLWLMNKSYLVLTDSGGIQEEAPSLGKPVLVMRDVTERKEGIEAGTAKLVGTNTDTIYNETKILLERPAVYNEMAQKKNPYGDGTTSKLIAEILKEHL